MKPGVILFLFLVAAQFFQVLMVIRTRRRDLVHDQTMQRVNGLLVIWAETWADLAVRAELQKVLDRYPLLETRLVQRERRATNRPQHDS